MRVRRTVPTPAVLGVVLACAGTMLLGGCAGPAEAPADEATTPDGVVEIPASFPAELPRPGGVLVSAAEGQTFWVLQYESVMGTEAERVVNDLAGSHSLDSETSVGDASVWNYSSPEYRITVEYTDEPDGAFIYEVSAN